MKPVKRGDGGFVILISQFFSSLTYICKLNTNMIIYERRFFFPLFFLELTDKNRREEKEKQNGIFFFSLDIIHPQIPFFFCILNGNRSK